MTDSTGVPPGWYPDATGIVRWWDGRQWTAHTQQQPPPQPAAGNPTHARPTNATPSPSGWFRPWVVVLALIVFFPLGLFLMWKGGLWSTTTRWVVTAAIAMLFVIGAVTGGSEPAPTAPVAAPSQVTASQPAAPPTAVPDPAASYAAAAEAAEAAADEAAEREAAASKSAKAEAKASKSAKAEAEAEAAAAAAEAAKPKLTVSQENAIEKAQDYLELTAFSKKGLIEQLEFEGFSSRDAKFAVNNISVNWNEQAAKKAEDYLDLTSFSRSGLIEQLEFEGFTSSQARYGVSQVGL